MVKNMRYHLKDAYVHKLVAKCFIKNDDINKTIANHKDLNKENNHVDNLEWVTPQENTIHYYKNRK